MQRDLVSSSPKRFDASGIFGFEIPLCHFQVVMGLKIHPEFWTIAKVQAQPKRGVSRDAPPIVDNLGDAVWRDADGFCKWVRDRPYSVRNSFLQHFAWRNRCKFVPCHRLLLSMIIHDPNFIRFSMKPFEDCRH